MKNPFFNTKMTIASAATALGLGLLAAPALACQGNGCYDGGTGYVSGDYRGGGVYTDIYGDAQSVGYADTDNTGDVRDRELFSDGLDRVELQSWVESNTCTGCAPDTDAGEPGNRVLQSGYVQSNRVTGAFLVTGGDNLNVVSGTEAGGSVRGYGGSYRFSRD